jgi:hypothetical protein
MAGDVKDESGQSAQDCEVELLLQWHVPGNWTLYRTAEAVTDLDGAFSFDMFAPPGNTFRLRVTRQGYREWLLDAPPSSSTPRRVHVTLLRDGLMPPGTKMSGR